MKNVIVSIVALAGIASVASAQIGTNDGRLVFQTWNGSSWSSDLLNANPGQTVQFRAVVSYAGANTNVFALGGITYQPTFSNADNDGTGAGLDTLGSYRNGGVQGSAIANSMLSAAEGNDGNALANGYGRVVFGGTAANTASQNVVTNFRHGGGAPVAGAPAGSWLRVAGSSVTNWPAASLPTAADATAAALNNINRGVLAGQQAQTNPATGLVNTFHVAGFQNVVIFRGAITLSDNTADRTLVLSTAAGSQQRVGGTNSADDNRFMTWQINNFGTTIQTGVVITDASIRVVPTPATAALLGLGGLVAARRRRA